MQDGNIDVHNVVQGMFEGKAWEYGSALSVDSNLQAEHTSREQSWESQRNVLLEADRKSHIF